MPHTASNLLVHFVFSTKQRIPAITPDIERDLHAYLGGIVREIGGKALIVGGTENHVHLLVRMSTTLPIADMVRVVKTNSSRWVHQKLIKNRAFAWQAGYGASSVSESVAPNVITYISRQKEHHRKLSYQDEFRSILKKNNIVVDERYLWD
jgi:REP element-mobilizing transposase RayT